MENNLKNREVAVRLSGVKKMYKLGQIGGGTLHGDLESWWARIRGKEDPNTIIGTNQRLVGKTFMALNGIDLTIYKGEAVGIIGGNGAGKSTMLKLLSRVTAPTEGEIDIYGRIASMLEVGTGFHGELTGRENVYMNGAILGMTKAEIDAKMEDIIEFSEVRDFIDTPVKRYSSGMYVKLAFSVAAHLDSEIMIMDEVLAVGDMAFQKKCLGKMRDAAKKEGRTVLYVSHNMNTIRQLCDRCIVLDKGRVTFEGDVEDAIEVYLQRNCDASQTRTFTTADHESWYSPKVEIEQVTIENDIATIQMGDLLRIHIRYKALKDGQDHRARLTVMGAGGELIGMSTSSNGLSFQSGSDGEFHMTFDTGMLAPGRYTTRFSIFSINEFGSHEYVCVLNDFIRFELQDKLKKDVSMRWDVRSWGHIWFPPFQIEVGDENCYDHMDHI